MMEPIVAAIVWTYNRYETLRDCLVGIQGQSYSVRHVIVVDSASPDGTSVKVRDNFPEVLIRTLATNLGMGSAIGEGLALASQLKPPPTHYWFVEDDSTPGPLTLESLLKAQDSHPNCDILGPQGAEYRRGDWRWLPNHQTTPCDFCMLDGSLYSSAAVSRLDPPRSDFFIMHIDVEYPLRAWQAGFQSLQVAGTGYRQLKMGANELQSPWRLYYETRNHFRMGIDQRSPALVWGASVRLLRRVPYALLTSRARPSFRFRIAGLMDALSNRMGRRLEPGARHPRELVQRTRSERATRRKAGRVKASP